MMPGLKRFIYSVIGVFFFVVIPCFIIVSNHIEKSMQGNEYLVTNVFGSASVQYQINHPIESSDGVVATYQNKSQWIQLERGNKIGNGALIKTDAFSYVEIMKANEMALRINANTLVRVDLIPTPKHVQTTLDFGKILCRINGDGPSHNGSKTDKFVVITKNSATHVWGTSFSVDYLQESKATNVSVLEGQVAVESSFNPQTDLPVSNGQNLRISTSKKMPVLSELALDQLKELQAVHNLQIELSSSDRWNDILDLATNSPLYNFAVTEITKYEMKVFLRAILHFAALRWQNHVPVSLKSVELESGDYIDPWGTEYFYEKLSMRSALIISAGPDKIIHTPDDIFMNITLSN
jgi:hypothetical protein